MLYSVDLKPHCWAVLTSEEVQRTKEFRPLKFPQILLDSSPFFHLWKCGTVTMIGME